MGGWAMTVLRILMAGLLAAAFSVASILAALPARAADAVVVTGEELRGFARLRFQWPAPVKVETQEAHGVVVLTFDRPFRAQLEKLPLELPNYVALARQDADGTTLRLAMKFPFRFEALSADNEVVVNLVPDAWQQPMPGLPREIVERQNAERDAAEKLTAAKRALALVELPDVPVRVGVQNAYSRLVFGWPDDVDYKVVRDGSTLNLSFSAAGHLKIGRLRVDPPPFVEGAETDTDLATTTLNLTISPEAEFRMFREPTGIVLDLTAANEDAGALAALELGQDAFDGVVPTDAASAARQSQAREVVVEVPAATGIQNDTGTDSRNDSRNDSGGQAENIVPDATPDTNSDIDASAAKVPVPRPAPRPPVPAAAPAPPLEPQDPKIAAAPDRPQSAPGSVRVERQGNTVMVSFLGIGDAPAAVFERAGYVWAVFETDTRIDLPQLTVDHLAIVDAVEAIDADGVQGVRLHLVGDALVTARSQNGVWSVAIGDTILAPPEALAIRRGVRAEGGGKLFAQARDAGRTHRLVDPHIGDVLKIVPLPSPIRGVLSPRETVGLEVLASAHGLAFRPIADDVEIARTGEGQVTASRRSGLVLTANPRRAPAAAFAGRDEVFAPGAVDFQLAYGKPEEFHPRLAALNAAVAIASTPNERRDARMALARFYLEYGFGTEALGVLRLIDMARRDQTADPEFMLTRSIGHYLIGRHEEALDGLSVPALLYDPHAALWRTLAYARLHRFVEARPDVVRARTVVADYAPQVQARFHLAAARIALGVNDIQLAEGDLYKVPDDALDAALFAERTLLAGMVAEASGETDEAVSRYAQAIALDYRPIAAEATLAQASLLLPSTPDDSKAAAKQEAIDTLDRLRFAWRGGHVEFQAVAELARLYEARGDYHSALSVMRTVATQFRDVDDARDITNQMMDMFRRLFLDGEVDHLKPLDALSLFYDFRELTPVGRDGDRMIRGLADRLIAVDLLDQAVEMLDHQVTHRLRGVARAQMAGRLAAVHLWNNAPGEALAALRKTRQAQLPRQIADERLLLEAKALSALDRHDHALELLADNKAMPARALAADVHWDAGHYAAAGGALEDLLGLRWTRDDALTPEEQFDVLRAAIAYVLAGDSDSVERIRQKYAEKMAQGPQAASFSIVASATDGRGMAFRDLAREIAQVDTLDRFMAGYRSRYEAGQAGETAIN